MLLTWLMHFCISLAMSLRRFDCLFLTKSWLCAALQIKTKSKKKFHFFTSTKHYNACVCCSEREKMNFKFVVASKKLHTQTHNNLCQSPNQLPNISDKNYNCCMEFYLLKNIFSFGTENKR